MPAGLSQLEHDTARATAPTLRRLAPRSNARGRRQGRSPRADPGARAPAAGATGSDQTLAHRALARAGRLRPAYRVHLPGNKGRPRWIVATKTALAYRPGNDGYAKRVATPAPAGLVTIKDFAAASGLPWATLHSGG